MTRGTLFCCCDKLIIESIEFNGDMYGSSHGKTVIRMLEQIETANEFRIAVEKFNKENHNYQSLESLTFPRKRSLYMKGNRIIMTDENYFKNFGSDWTFWKNISNKTITINTIDKKLITLNPMEQVAINFGESKNYYKSLDECLRQIALESELLKQAA